MTRDPELKAHLEWLGYLQPVGLVVSPPALLDAQAHIDRNVVPDHGRFLEWVETVRLVHSVEVKVVKDLPGFLCDVLNWEARDLHGGPGTGPLPSDLEVVLPEYGETLRPTYAVPRFEKAEEAKGNGGGRWILLIQEIETGSDLDLPAETDERRWPASPQARFERLLRELETPIGLLSNGTHLRLVYAPRGETSGHLTFPVQAMSEVAGRPVFAGLKLLLHQDRLFVGPENERLPGILEASRKYQSVVSTRLAGQVLEALYEILRGFQAADERRGGLLLNRALREDPDHVYAGVLTVLLRLVFILYAEDRGLLPSDPIYANNYSVTGLFQRLRADAGRYPDTMDQRYGAWAQLLALFRLIHDGGSHRSLRLPPRHGHLFNPDRYGFLEGRAAGEARVLGERIDPPAVPEGVIYRVLEKLLILDGERLSYRTLDVEQIGLVYEMLMGFHLEVVTGRSIAIKPSKPHGAPAAVNLEELLEQKPAERAAWLRERAEQELSGEALEKFQEARTPEDAVASLERKVAREATPSIMPPGTMVLQPSDERRRSGSHYTPRSLTEPIVRTTLRPVLDRLGERPAPEEILDLKVLDPAMGSGAFLVEACRQLGDELVKAWHAHGQLPRIPPDEDEVLHARRLVAQRCLYGVDKNPLATDLAKLSLWLATLARDHPFTFLDHALRSGDSLVGLTQSQIAAFHWEKKEERDAILEMFIEERIRKAMDLRAKIREAGEEAPEESLRIILKDADDALDDVRLIGDLAIAGFFLGKSSRERVERLGGLFTKVLSWLSGKGDVKEELKGLAEEIRELELPVTPFHWEIEFPEVFGRENSGFDAIVGNPPFLGGKRISKALGDVYLSALSIATPSTSKNVDLCGYFHLRCGILLRKSGRYGLISTERILIGDSKIYCLDWLSTYVGTFYRVSKGMPWPGEASVFYCVLHFVSGFPLTESPKEQVEIHKLSSNARLSFVGAAIQGMGFVLEPDEEYLAAEPDYSIVIRPFLIAKDFNETPRSSPRRYIVFFADMTLKEAEKFPIALNIVRNRVKPYRDTVKREAHQVYWWRYGDWRPGLFTKLREQSRTIVIGMTSKHLAFNFVPATYVFDQTTAVITSESSACFAVLSSRLHFIWALRQGAGLG
ncbi:MAG: N-6 DNA methylase [Planctomycetes bacterium]|nr:N-6 DNA methylase [Planctomycetota bacterium]